jgi:hypothetical protein
MNLTSIYSIFILILAALFAYAAINETRYAKGSKLIAATMAFTSFLCVAVVVAAAMVVPS